MSHPRMRPDGYFDIVTELRCEVHQPLYGKDFEAAVSERGNFGWIEADTGREQTRCHA